MKKQLLNKMAVISDEIAELQKAETIDAEAIKNKTDEYNKLKAQVEALEEAEAVQNHANASQRKTDPVIQVGNDLASEKKFKNSGEFLRAVHNAAFGEMDKRLRNEGAAEFNGGEDGAFLMPPEFIAEIQKKVMGPEQLLGMAKRLPVSGNSITLPVNETARWDATTGGVQSYWTGEAKAMTKSKPTFNEFELRLKKLTTMVRVTDELREDVPALEAWLRMEASEAIGYKNTKAIISGSNLSIMPAAYKHALLF